MFFEEKVKDALLEAVFVTRWKKDGTSQYALLTTCELKETINDIIHELDKAGFEIVTKTKTKSKPVRNEKKQKAKRSFSRNRSTKIEV